MPPPDKRRVVIVEDHTLLRQGLKALLTKDPDVEVVGEADNGLDAIKLASSAWPCLMMMDLSLPGINGIEAIREIKKLHPTIKILVLTVHMAEEYVREALKAGADGYVLKLATQEELVYAIKSVLNGKSYLSPDIAAQVVNGYLDHSANASANPLWDSVTLREREILKLVAEGRPNKYIAAYFTLSLKTIEKHRSNLMKKLDLHNVASLTAFAIEKGIISGSQRLNG